MTLSLGGYAGLTLGWVEGVEVNLLGAVAGFDLRRSALKLPGLGRLGLPSAGLPPGLAAWRRLPGFASGRGLPMVGAAPEPPGNGEEPSG